MRIKQLRLTNHPPVSVETSRGDKSTTVADIMRHVRKIESEQAASDWARRKQQWKRKQRKLTPSERKPD